MRILAAILALFLCSCTVGPNYKRPQVALPEQFRAAPAGPPAAASLADTKWFDLFGDDSLRKLVDSALQQNFDLRIAAERILQARAQYGIQRASLFPFLNGNAQWNATRASTLGSLPFIPEATRLEFAYTQATLNASWELDLWGRIRRLTESARAQYFASEEARNGVVVSLVSDVTSAYFSLLELDLELAVSRQTREIAVDGLRLTQLRRDRGAASGLDVRQAEQLLYTATSQIAAVERSIGQTEDQISFLTGQAPASISRGKPLEQFSSPPEVPAGLPASLLERRPDVRQSEQLLVSANANIGAARAQYFPQISLTALAGGQSRALTELFTSPARLLTLNPGATIPIFRAGQLRSNVRFTEAQQREALIGYQRTIYGALRDVSDSLIGVTQTRIQRTEQDNLVRSLTERSRLARLRYEGGVDSYLQVLDAQRDLFSGQLVLAQVRLLELQSVVRLYRSLGGGWQ